MFLKIFRVDSQKWQRTLNQYFMAILISIPVMSYSMMMSWISPAALLLKSKDTPSSRPITDDEISWIASIAAGTAIPGVVLFGIILEKLGRKIALICLSIPLVICWMIKLCSMEPWALILARAIAGLSAGGTYNVPPIYVKEMSDDNVRGTLGIFVSVFQNAGYVAGYLIGAVLDYRTVLWISISIPIIHILVFCKMPDSPSYMVKIGDYEGARKVLAWLRRLDENDDGVIRDIKKYETQQVQVNNESNISLKSLIQTRETRKTLILCLMMMSVEEFGGIFALGAYQGTVFDKAKDGSVFFEVFSPNLQAVFVAILQLIGSILASILIERCGRKPLLLVTDALIMVAMGALGTWFCLSRMGILLPGWLPVIFMSLAVICSAIGLMSVAFVVITEVTDFQTRGLIVTISIAYNWTIGFILMKSFYPIEINFGIDGIFWIFTVGCFLNFFYIWLCVPETKGKSIECIQSEICGTESKSLKPLFVT